MFSFRRAIFCGVGALATLALSTGTALASPIQVTTTGCFNCTPAEFFEDIASYSGYTFDGVTMSNGVPDAFGNVSLGTLSRDNENYSQSDAGSDFVLQVTFHLPLGFNSSGHEFFATIAGTQGQPGYLDFADAFKTYTFPNESGIGSFEFRVNDILSLNKNESATLWGNIQFTPTVADDPTPVPEPASLLLLGSGLVVVARRFRRRASK